jgi:RHS repeat-associated protein
VPITNHYDPSGRVDWQKDQLGRQTTYDYTTIAGSTKVTDPKGNITVYGYANGEMVSLTRGYGTPQAVTWSYTYDPGTLGLTSVTDPNQHTTTMAYDDRGNMVSRTDALGHTTTWTYDGLNDVLTVKDPKGVTTTMTYDSGGNLKSTSTPWVEGTGAQTTTYDYDPAHAGDLTSAVDPNTKTWTYTYDTNGDLASVRDPVTPTANTTAFCYDGVGRRTATISAKGTASGVTCASTRPAAYTTYQANNAFGQPTQVTDPLGHQPVTNTYDLNDNLKTVKDGDNNVTTYNYDLANQLTQVARADTTTLGNDYWGDGSLKSQTDGAGHSTSYAYDPAGRLSTVTDPNTRVTTYGYDAAGNRTTVQQPGGNCAAVPKVACITYGFDAANETTSVTYSDPGTPGVSNIAYDADGQRTSMTDGTGTSSWTWDSLHRLSQSTNGAGATVGYGYDLKGEVTSITYPGTTGTVGRTYYEDGQLKTVTDWGGRVTTFNYDADRFMTQATYGTTGSSDTFTPDGADRLMGSAVKSGTTTLASLTYGRDNANQVNSVASTGLPSDSHSYSYTQLNQLKNVDTDSYAYDAADNLTLLPGGGTQAFDSANEMSTSAATALEVLFGGTDDKPIGADYDGDGKTDRAIYRPATGLWAVHRSTGGDTTQTFGISTDDPRPADYDGDGKADVAVWRDSSATWYIQPSSGGALTATAYGSSGDTPVPADYDGDGKADIATFRPSDGTWHIHRSSGGDTAMSYGTTGDLPVPADYDGDGKADIAVWRPSTGVWYVHRSSDGVDTALYYGTTGDVPVAADYDGDSKADIGIYRPGTGLWIHQSSGGDVGITYGGLPNDKAVPADYDGDHHVDIAIYRPGTSATWWVQPTTLVNYSYDNRGNRAVATPQYGSAKAYSYDQADRLTSAGGASYAYDGDGLRISKTMSGTTKPFTYDRASGLPLVLSDGDNKYIYGADGLPLEQIDASGNVNYFHHDQLGSTRMLTDSSGVVRGTFTYDAYGNLAGHGGTSTSPLGYAGQYTDPETGLQYARARYYDPVTGQFLTRDPITALTRESYSYTGGNPLNFRDPNGLSKCGDWLDPGSYVDCASKAVPDYVVLNPSVCILPTACYGANLTVTKTGHLYAGYETGVGKPGGIVGLRGGWINQKHNDCDIDGFVNGGSVTGEAFIPIWHGLGPDVGETVSPNPDGTYGSATEAGVGFGEGKTTSLSSDHVWQLF